MFTFPAFSFDEAVLGFMEVCYQYNWVIPFNWPAWQEEALGIGLEGALVAMTNRVEVGRDEALNDVCTEATGHTRIVLYDGGLLPFLAGRLQERKHLGGVVSGRVCSHGIGIGSNRDLPGTEPRDEVPPGRPLVRAHRGVQ